jgi:hypothetical protein
MNLAVGAWPKIVQLAQLSAFATIRLHMRIRRVEGVPEPQLDPGDIGAPPTPAVVWSGRHWGSCRSPDRGEDLHEKSDWVILASCQPLQRAVQQAGEEVASLARFPHCNGPRTANSPHAT